MEATRSTLEHSGEKEVFVFTGKLSFRRREAFRIARKAGHDVSGGFTSRATCLVAGRLSRISRKGREASRRGVRVISEDEFLKMTGAPWQLRIEYGY